jgi:Na+/H+ antiporter NhaD/arsenite permease-like protein
MKNNENLISDRAFWGAVYGLAIGVNFSSFSIAFCASLGGFQWREALARKHIRFGVLEFARVNLPIFIFAVIVSCAVLVGEVYIKRSNSIYHS